MVAFVSTRYGAGAPSDQPRAVNTVLAMEQIPPPRRVIRLFCDYCRDYPLWENSTPTWDVGYATTPETYGLSHELSEDLAGWQAFFEQHADPFEGWDTEANHEKWLRDGERLAHRLQQEVQGSLTCDGNLAPGTTGRERLDGSARSGHHTSARKRAIARVTRLPGIRRHCLTRSSP